MRPTERAYPGTNFTPYSPHAAGHRRTVPDYVRQCRSGRARGNLETITKESARKDKIRSGMASIRTADVAIQSTPERLPQMAPGMHITAAPTAGRHGGCSIQSLDLLERCDAATDASNFAPHSPGTSLATGRA